MSEIVPIHLKKDDSVERIIQLKAKDLEYKFKRTRKINERLLRKKTPLGIFFEVVYDIVAIILFIGSALLCFASVNSTLQKVCPTFAGYSNLTIVSGSMTRSGFDIGDNVIVHSVDTHSLNENDIIAFYGYPKDYNRFDRSSVTRVVENNETVYTFKLLGMLGYQTDAIKEAGQSGSGLYFHHIRAIYEDENGVRWFKTYGSSNSSDDSWYISEDMIIGVYDDSKVARFISALMKLVTSSYGIFILLTPIFMIALAIIIECIKDVQLAFLELDCVEEKRKITDKICVDNDIGFNMDEKTKYKILAQAKPEEINLYVKYLWKSGNVPLSIKKYYLKKNALYIYDKKLVELNRECNKMFNEGKSAKTVAIFYLKEKEKIEEEYRLLAKRLKQRDVTSNTIGSENVDVMKKSKKKKFEVPKMVNINTK